MRTERVTARLQRLCGRHVLVRPVPVGVAGTKRNVSKGRKRKGERGVAAEMQRTLDWARGSLSRGLKVSIE